MNRVPDKDLEEEIKRLISEYGWISTSIVKKHSEITYSVFTDRYGSFAAIREKYGLFRKRSFQDLFLDYFEDITGISLEREYSLALLGGGHQRFDGYNEFLRLAVEYDTEDHFKPLSSFGGEKGLKERQERDSRKDSFCKENNIVLIRFPYNLAQTEENIKMKYSEAFNLLYSQA